MNTHLVYFLYAVVIAMGFVTGLLILWVIDSLLKVIKKFVVREVTWKKINQRNMF